MTLDEYFHLIVNNKPPKELTMFEVMKAKWTEFFTTQFKWIEETKEPLEPEDYWAFYAHTSAYDDITAKETFINGEQDGTWMEVLDQILDVMSFHYGYDIKEQVYYSVEYPLNEIDERTGKPFAGYGRCLNDNLLQQLLLAHPEVYESHMFGKPTKDLFA